NGSYAEEIAVNQLFVSKKPANLSYKEAASVPLAALTAYQALRNFAGLSAGERVFISAGSGGVGSFAIQIAKIIGAEVVTTTGPNNIDYVKSLGADEVFDYTKTDSYDTEPVDVVFDLIGGKSQLAAFSLLKEGGRIGSIAGAPDPELAKEKKAIAKGLWVVSSGADLDELRNYIESGKITTEIAAEFPLHQVKEAHELSEKGHVRGKIVIEVAK
ncbi:alcohol dehydrogenase zinc-binding domain-containing protein, partial [Listeria floridensis FSL S10-1187]